MKTSKPNGECQGRKKSGSEAAALQRQDGRSNAAPLQGNHKKVDAELVWKQFEDLVVPQLKLSAVDHAVYSYLLRHSHLEGKRRLHLSMYKLGRGTHLSAAGARHSVRRMVEKGALKLVERSKAGHVIEVRLPAEIRRVRAKLAKESASEGPDLDKVSFWRDKGLRAAIHRREGGKCFYCLRRVKARLRCIDHVVPQVRCGPNSYRNLVSSCVDCNAEKQEEEAGNFLRKLYREERLTLEELNGRLRALKDLAAGRMRPEVGVKDVKQKEEKEKADSSGLKA